MASANGAVLTVPQGFQPKIGSLKADMPITYFMNLFGLSGVGKTRLAATAPKPILYINIDRGIESIKGLDGIDVYPALEEERLVESWDELNQIVDWLHASPDARKYKTKVFDTMTAAGRLLRHDILSEAGPTDRFHDETMSLADYNLFANRMTDMLLKIRSLPGHNIIITQPRDLLIGNEEDPDKGLELLRLSDFGEGQKVSQTAPAFFGLVGYLEARETDQGEVVRELLVRQVGNRRTKVRTAPGVEAPVAFADPDLTKIFAYLSGELKPEDRKGKK